MMSSGRTSNKCFCHAFDFFAWFFILQQVPEDLTAYMRKVDASFKKKMRKHNIEDIGQDAENKEESQDYSCPCK